MVDQHKAGDLIIQGARQNNLRNITVSIPHNAVTVITGVSGSGKSSLAFDTLYAEGQWRYVESLSTYTRMFVERLDRPDVDQLINIRPAIAIEQKNSVRTARSTVGTATEVADHLRLLFATIGHSLCPHCQQEARADSPDSVVEGLLSRFPQARAMVLFPIPDPAPGDDSALVASLLRRGFVRLLCGEKLVQLDYESGLPSYHPGSLHVVLDRLVIGSGNRRRLMEAVETAFLEGGGLCRVDVMGQGGFVYSAEIRCPGCGFMFGPVRPVLFSFNHPLGACPECKGFGNVLRYDEDLVVPDKTRSLAEGAIEPWTKPATARWQGQMLRGLKRRNFDVTTPYAHLSERERRLVWHGTRGVKGVEEFFQTLEGKRYKLHVRVFLSRYRSPVPCMVCGGSRLQPKARYVKICGRDIHEVSQLTLGHLDEWLATLNLSRFEAEVAGDILKRLRVKLDFLLRVRLDYLTLSRETRTLSGGEAQRISLANQLGARLVGTLYVLDEPTIGLHARDTATLAGILRDLARQGNTVVVVEHDRQVIEQADHVIELGPWAGEKGGEVVSSTPRRQFLADSRSLTARFLRGDESIPLPQTRRSGNGRFLILHGACEHNLQNLTVRFPLGVFICVTGVSGSGKSTLVENTLYRAAARAFDVAFLPGGRFSRIRGLEHLRTTRLIDQKPIGRTPRSNPITYLKGYQGIRELFASTPLAKRLGLTPSHFSFNSGQGRCQRCGGNGFEKLDMFFFEDLYVTCEDCGGRRFRPEVLGVRFRGFPIDGILKMTVQEAESFFGDALPSLRRILRLLTDLGLGYLRLGQPATSLSGGEAQRLKIASELVAAWSRPRGPLRHHHIPSPGSSVDESRSLATKREVEKVSGQGGVLYILDEPTTGLHLADVKNLLLVLNRLVDSGNTVIVVEHHLDIIKVADWVIDLGPEGGDKGGRLVAEGRPEDIAEIPQSHTGRFLRPFLRVPPG